MCQCHAFPAWNCTNDEWSEVTQSMDKREFLKASGVLVAGSMLPQVVKGQELTGPRQNWAGNLTFSTNRLYSPGSVDEVRQVVKDCAKLRALGSRHSFNTIADSTQNQISVSYTHLTLP